jgi:hypothetical protein
VRSTALALALCLCGACASSPPRTVADAYRVAAETAREHGGFRGLSEGDDAALLEARARVIEIVARGEIESPAEAVQAAFVLCSSRDAGELAMAHELALAGADGGDARGLPLAAEALDRALVLRGETQRYGTQIGFEPVLGRYRVLPVDPHTTDADRAAFGLPTLAELEQIAESFGRPER